MIQRKKDNLGQNHMQSVVLGIVVFIATQMMCRRAGAYDHDINNDRLTFPKLGIALPIPTGWQSYRVESVSNILAEYQHRHLSIDSPTAQQPALVGQPPAARAIKDAESLLSTSAKDIDIHIIAAIDFPALDRNSFSEYINAQIRTIAKHKHMVSLGEHHIVHPVYDIRAVELSAKDGVQGDTDRMGDLLQCFVRVRPNTVLIFTLLAQKRSARIPIYLQYIINHMSIQDRIPNPDDK